MEDKYSQIRNLIGNDKIEEVGESGFFANIIMGISMGLGFYSIIPLNLKKIPPLSLKKMAPTLPIVSLIIGFFPALILYLLSLIGLPPLLAASLAVASFALISGAMAEDGLADSFDGLFGGKNIAERLEILKDSRLGTYGILALIIYVLVKIFALAALISISPLSASFLWLGATIMARSGAIFLPLKLTPARSHGVSANIGKLDKFSFYIGLIFALLISTILVAPFGGFFAIFLATIILIIITIFWTWLSNKLILGQTGDLIGALQGLLEIGALCVFVFIMNF